MIEYCHHNRVLAVVSLVISVTALVVILVVEWKRRRMIERIKRLNETVDKLFTESIVR